MKRRRTERQARTAPDYGLACWLLKSVPELVLQFPSCQLWIVRYMTLPVIEDEFEDVLGKAMRGLALGVAEIGRAHV